MYWLCFLLKALDWSNENLNSQLRGRKYNWNFLVGKVVEGGILTKDKRKGNNGEVSDARQTKTEEALSRTYRRKEK